MDGELTGTVKWFSRIKGWGFNEPDGGDRDVFVHFESIVGEGFRNLEKGNRVRFRIEDTPRGPKAMDVSAHVYPSAHLADLAIHPARAFPSARSRTRPTAPMS